MDNGTYIVLGDGWPLGLAGLMIGALTTYWLLKKRLK